MKRWLYRLVNRNWWQIPAILLAIAAILAAVLLLSGCGTATTSRERINELVEIEGSAGGLPVSVVMRRTQTTQGETSTTLDIPWGEVGQAALSGLAGPLGGAGLGGLVAAAGMWWLGGKTRRERDGLARQRNELIDGVEVGKAKLPEEQWAQMRDAMAIRHSAETQAAVRERTAGA